MRPPALRRGTVVLGAALTLLLLLPAAASAHGVDDAAGPCTSGERVDTLPYGQGGHPSKDFYEPAEPAPLKDFGHVLGDAFVIVQYRPTLPADQVDQLRTFVTGKEGGKVSAGARPDQAAVLTATHVRGTLTCTAFDLPALRQFTQAWFADPRSKVAE